MGAGAPDPVVKVSATGSAINPRNFRVKLNGDSIIGQVMDYYDYARVSATVPVSRISGGTAKIDVVNMCDNPGTGWLYALRNIYPRQFNFQALRSFYFELEPNAAGNYLEITNYAHNSVVPILYDITNKRRYQGDISNPALTSCFTAFSN